MRRDVRALAPIGRLRARGLFTSEVMPRARELSRVFARSAAFGAVFARGLGFGFAARGAAFALCACKPQLKI